jgi:hypothetical protein
MQADNLDDGNFNDVILDDGITCRNLYFAAFIVFIL